MSLELGEGEVESAEREGRSKPELTKLRRALAPSKARLSRAERDVGAAQGRSLVSALVVDARSAWLRAMEHRPRGEVITHYRSALIKVSAAR